MALAGPLPDALQSTDRLCGGAVAEVGRVGAGEGAAWRCSPRRPSRRCCATRALTRPDRRHSIGLRDQRRHKEWPATKPKTPCAASSKTRPASAACSRRRALSGFAAVAASAVLPSAPVVAQTPASQRNAGRIDVHRHFVPPGRLVHPKRDYLKLRATIPKQARGHGAVVCRSPVMSVSPSALEPQRRPRCAQILALRE